MQYKSRKEYTADCVVAAVGTLLDEKYAARDFETVVLGDSPEQETCADFIRYVKSTEDKDYVSRNGFNEYLLNNSSDFTVSDRQKEISDLIFELVESNKQSNHADLKDPKTLYNKLYDAKRKTSLFNSVKAICDADEFFQDAICWNEAYCESLQKSIEEATSEYASSVEDEEDLFTADVIREYYRKKVEDRKNGETYSFHNKILDSLITEGPTPGHGGIIGGSTGMGKSALCLNLVNDLINADVPVLYFPIEMGVENTIDRLVAIRTGYPFKDIVRIGRTREVNNELEAGILHEIDSLTVHPNFAIVNKARVDMKYIKNTIKRFQSTLPGKKYCIVIFDLLLQIKEFFDDGTNMPQMIERAINKLDILAKELNCHWIGVVQLGRAAESDKVLSEQAIDKLRPTRTSIKNSNALLERARWAITIFRKRYFADLYLDKETAQGIDDIAEIQLMKANDEEISRRYATFDGPTFRVTYNSEYGKSANGF